MKIAVPYWNNRISPVLDTADNFLLIETQNGRWTKDININLSEKSISERVEYFKKHHVSVLLCGAISEYYHNLILAKGIRVIPWLTGDISGIIEAFICNNSFEPGSVMPGCRACGQRRRKRRGKFK